MNISDFFLLIYLLYTKHLLSVLWLVFLYTEVQILLLFYLLKNFIAVMLLWKAFRCV